MLHHAPMQIFRTPLAHTKAVSLEESIASGAKNEPAKSPERCTGVQDRVSPLLLPAGDAARS